ncbi:hypothetical protein phiK7B1_111 [Pseudomonas phage phiK7B1]|nr:hypothetical protein phiK7B1_111 [Pseudomonas phage phiK7B1]UIS24674.1 hypothetical protein S21ZY_112 [Pseudomonas phage ZY21]
MPSVAVCPNADVPVDIVKSLKGFEDELGAITFLVEQYLSKATGRLDAGSKLQAVDNAVRIGKLACIDDHFGD